jgi:hypothetical protein
LLAWIVAFSALNAGLEVDWVAPPGCPDAAAIEEAVHARLDEALEAASASVRGHVQGRPGAWRLDLEVRTSGATVSRRVRDPDCVTLTDAAALIVAVAIERAAAPSDPVLRSIESSTPTAIAWNEIRFDRPQPRDADPPEPEPEPRSSWRLGARAAAGLGVGALPGVGADVEIAALVQRKRFIAEVGARYEPPRRARYPDAPESGGDLSLWAIRAAACFAPAVGRVRFPLCGGAEAGGMYGRGVGLPVQRRAHLPWAAARAGAGLSVAVLPWLRLAANAELLVPFSRPRFSTDSRGPVHEAAPVAGRFNLGLEFTRS